MCSARLTLTTPNERVLQEYLKDNIQHICYGFIFVWLKSGRMQMTNLCKFFLLFIFVNLLV